MNERDKEIRKLRKEKQYEKIYYLYGPEVLYKNMPIKQMKKDIEKLMQEGRFMDIYAKYPRLYNKYEKEMLALEICNKKENILKSIFIELKKIIKLSSRIGLMTVFLSNSTDRVIRDIKIQQMYSDRIKEYNENVNKYVQDLNKLKLNDTELFVKLIDDMWKQIDGYGEPKLDVIGFWRLDFVGENQQGVCRNMADDITNKLNVINPEYNARNFSVYMDEDVEIQTIDIKRTLLQGEQTNSAELNSIWPNNIDQLSDEIRDKGAEIIERAAEIIKVQDGNHMVTAVDVNGETIIIDSTNPSIGYFKNGQIHMFWNEDQSGLKYSVVENIYMDALKNLIPIRVPTEIARSFLTGNMTEEELEEKFGIEAQNRALEKIKKLEEKDETFQESIKVEVDKDIITERQQEDITNRNKEIEGR